MVGILHPNGHTGAGVPWTSSTSLMPLLQGTPDGLTMTVTRRSLRSRFVFGPPPPPEGGTGKEGEKGIGRTVTWSLMRSGHRSPLLTKTVCADVRLGLTL
jgi:hypothetical protein